MGGYWIEILLLLLLAGTLFLLYRSRPAAARIVGGRDDEEPFAGSELTLTSYFPALSRQAGFDPAVSRWPYWLAKIALLLLLPLLAVGFWPVGWQVPGWIWLCALAILGFLLPDLYLLARRKKRRSKITSGLTYFLDLLVSLLHGGLDLREAFRRAGREGFAASHPLAREAALVVAELDAGREPDEAFRAMADRTGVRELRGVASSLGLALRAGASVRATLETQAETLWIRRRENALRRINTAVVKAVFPIFLCGLPIFFVLVFFPAMVELGSQLGELLSVW